MRLYPALLFATAAYLLYLMEFWGKTFEPWTILGNLVLLQGIWELGVQPIIVPTWSLTFEWIFYLGFPLLLLLPSARSGLRPRHIAFAAVVVLLILLVGQQYTRLLMFLSGAAFALAPRHVIRQVAARTPNWLVIVLYLLGNVYFAVDQNWSHFIPVYLLTSGLLVAKVLSGEPSFCRVLSWEPLRRLGTISYSFYLFHGLGIVIFCDQIFPLLHVPRGIQFVAMLAGSYVFSIGMAAVSYHLLERPYFERHDYHRQHRIWRHRMGLRWRALRQRDLVTARFPSRVAGAKVSD
jgi:peptidoglycan/LPS O-acetylase OafA/YrhL